MVENTCESLTDKGLVSKIQRESIPFNNKERKNLIKKRGEDLNRQFS